MSLLTDYRRNYRKIAHDHVVAWNRTGKNPFQDPAALKINEDSTFGNVTRYVPAGGRVLDAGCGMGDLMLRLTEYETVGVEIAQPYLKVAWERGLDVRNARIEKLPFPARSFDGVVAADILEHVIDLHSAVKELLRVLAYGGHIVVRVPNAEEVGWPPLKNYPFIHLRILDQGTLGILFERIFGCAIVEMYANEQVIHLVARK